MTLVGICERCRAEKPPNVALERRNLHYGPNGERLCQQHKREAWDSETENTPLHCDVRGCDNPAIVRVLPTHGETEHHALRCRDCLEYDFEREWFKAWKGQIEGRQEDVKDA